MITKNGDTYTFNVNSLNGELFCVDNVYTLNFQDQKISFTNIKLLHVFVNVLTDIVETIDSVEHKKYGE